MKSDSSQPQTAKNAPPRRMAVIGGGLTGLSAAYYLQKLEPRIDVELYEATARLGGVAGTVHRDGFLIESSADCFLATESAPWARELIEEIGVSDELISTNDSCRRALVLWRDRLEPVPQGFRLMGTASMEHVWSSPLLSWRGKLRLAAERLVAPRRDGQDESLAEFATRRVGREAYQRIVQPLVSGIYSADPQQLSVAAALPQFAAMERRFGSLAIGLRATESDAGKDAAGARYSMFAAPRRGMQSLVEQLAGKLDRCQLNLQQPVKTLRAGHDGRWHVRTDKSVAPQAYDGVVLATDAKTSARLLREVHDELAGHLSDIEYAGVAVVSCGLERNQIGHSLAGFGFVVPMIEKRRILATSFSSVKFAKRAPEGKVLLRTFVGGAGQEAMVDWTDAELQQTVLAELRGILRIQGEPLFWTINRWPKRTPQYTIGHLKRVESIRNCVGQLSCLELAGNYFNGVGIPQCVREGRDAAARLQKKAYPRVKG